jgi:hypothetical protein
VGVIRNIIKSGISLCVPRADRLWLCQGGEGNHLGATFDAERKSGHLHEKEGLGDVTRRGGEIKISPDGRLESERERERESEEREGGASITPLSGLFNRKLARKKALPRLFLLPCFEVTIAY